jgi:oxygen-dependent protoporphyrinogen oxidase
MQKTDVVVIGAGIAGLSAAYYLQKAGHKVIVLEASERVGGRMKTEQLNSHYLDFGAQFLTQGYTHILSLLKEVNLQQDLIMYEPWLALAEGKKITRFNLNNPTQFFFSGLLTWSLRFQLLQQSKILYDSIKKRDMHDYADWHKLDDVSMPQWIKQNFSGEVTKLNDTLFNPLVESLYFHCSDDQFSKAAALAVIRFFKYKFYTLSKGLGSLPQALAQRLEVRCHAQVQKLQIQADKVFTTTKTQRYESKWVVLATTATAAKQIYSQADGIESDLLSTDYASSLCLNLLMSETWHNKQLNQLYGMLIPASQRQYVAAITMDKKPTNKVLGLYLTGRTADLMQQADDMIFQTMLADTKSYIPNVEQHIDLYRMAHWKEAIPHSPVGRSQKIYQYKQAVNKQQKVLLAGDYMGFSDVNSAAHTGIWAANQIIDMEKT